ncbi:glucokinase [Marinobacter salicampi]|uniref:glucokinase n=1 Tax=Marinobacter salicampi TaxID=435907 RepID=UPI00140E940D|nr:glucokinase [Marinobacter salicampi]
MTSTTATTSLGLVADIGGTHARFALVADDPAQPDHAQRVLCADYRSLQQAIETYLEKAAISGDAIDRACIALASPIRGDAIAMTNNPWQFRISELKRRFGWQTLKVINDFTAMALGVPHVSNEHLVALGGGPAEHASPRLVIGPGTGLGVSGLVPTRNGWVPLATEGGHVDLPVSSDDEIELLRILRRRFGRVSAERVLSGPGLVNLYQAYAQMQGQSGPFTTPQQVVQAAVGNSDTLARATLLQFCEWLGRVAGNAALTLGSRGGVYLCGGLLPRMAEFLAESGFRAGFEAKGRMRSIMEATPVYLVTDDATALYGSAEALGNEEVGRLQN